VIARHLRVVLIGLATGQTSGGRVPATAGGGQRGVR
jgi:hypothetical protein